MTATSKVLLLVVFSLFMRPAASAQQSESKSRKHTLSEVILELVKLHHVSILAEITQPMPSNIDQMPDHSVPLEETLTSLTHQFPQYTWYKAGNVIVFGSRFLLSSSENPMNVVVPRYRLPSNLSDFKLTFPGAVESAKYRKDGAGGVVTGIGLPQNMSPSLKQEILINAPARKILIAVASQVGNLFSVLILPSQPSKVAPKNQRFVGWEIAGGKGLGTYTTYMRDGVPSGTK